MTSRLFEVIPDFWPISWPFSKGLFPEVSVHSYKQAGKEFSLNKHQSCTVIVVCITQKGTFPHETASAGLAHTFGMMSFLLKD